MKYDYSKERLKEAVELSTTYVEVLRLLNIPTSGDSSKILKNYIAQYNIDTSHFTGHRKAIAKYIPAEEYLNKDKFIAPSKLLIKLYKEGIKNKKCECCGITEWNSKEITFQLHHIDGNHNNNALENLQVLCPNCHSQTDNYCGNANKRSPLSCIECGREVKTKHESGLCVYCAIKKLRRANRPSLEVLLEDVLTLGYSGTGRKYKVSDNTIRKWIKSYQELL